MAGRVESEYRQRFTAVDQTGRAFRSLNGNLRKTERGFSAASKALGAFGAGLSVAAVTSFARAQANLARQIEDAAAKTGLAVEDFQSYQQVAKEAGINSRSFEMALQRLTRRIGEAANGQGELLKVVENYGLAVRDSNGNIRDTESVLRDLARIISETESAQEQLFITTRAFDAEGADFVNILRQGADALEAARMEAEGFAAVAEEDVEALADLAASFDAFATLVQTKVLGALAEVSDVIKESLDNWREFLNVTDRERFNELFTELQGINDEIAKLNDRAGSASGRNLRGIEQQLSRLTKRAAELRSELAALQQSPPTAPIPGPTAAPPAATQGGAPAASASGPSVQQQIEQMNREFMEEFNRAAEQDRGFEERWAEQTNRIQEQIREVNEFAQEAARSMQRAFSDFFFDPLEDGFEGMATSFANAIRRMVADIASQKLLTAFFQQFAGGSGLLGNFSQQALQGLGGGVVINAPGADASTVARIETVAARTESVIRDNARRGRLT